MAEFDHLGHRLDIIVGDSDASQPKQPAVSRGSERFVGIRFLCCGTYARIRVNRQGNAYQGHCPKCSRPIRIEIGPGGSDSRFFEVG